MERGTLSSSPEAGGGGTHRRVHRIREIDAFLGALKAHDRELLPVDDLKGFLPNERSAWRALLDELVDAWRSEAGESCV